MTLASLPPALQAKILKVFKKEEIPNNFELIYKCVLDAESKSMPLQNINMEVKFKNQNPSQHYCIVNRLAQDTLSRTFLVRKFADEKMFALKFIKPRDKAEYQNIKNEVAIMKMKGNSILHCIDAYDFSEKLWIFRELMDIGNLRQIFKDRKGKGLFDEKFCKYILLKIV